MKRSAELTSPPSTGKAPRRSERPARSPARFRPSSTDVPSDLLELIHSVANQAASNSKVPFDPSAVTALEECLEPLLEALCEAAHKHAQKQNRDEITELDLRAVSKTFMKAH